MLRGKRTKKILMETGDAHYYVFPLILGLILLELLKQGIISIPTWPGSVEIKEK